MSTFPATVNEQIGHEFAASQQYIAIAVYYDTETLPQLAAHFYRQAVEERNHAMMLVQYLLDAGEDVTIPGVDAPQTAFSDAVAPVKLALDQEKAVTEQIAALVALAREEGELVGEQFLHWFLQEQREEVSSMGALLTVVERSKDNVMLIEDFLARQAVGDAGDFGTGRLSPPARQVTRQVGQAQLLAAGPRRHRRVREHDRRHHPGEVVERRRGRGSFGEQQPHFEKRLDRGEPVGVVERREECDEVRHLPPLLPAQADQGEQLAALGRQVAEAAVDDRGVRQGGGTDSV